MTDWHYNARKICWNFYKKFIIIGDAGNFRGFWWNNPFFPISKGFNYYENRQTEIVQEILDE